MKLFSRTLLACALVAGVLPVAAAPAPPMPPKLPSMREQDAIRQEWLKLRLERVLPTLMRRHGVSMWLVINREYNEDPVFRSLISPSVMYARRRTILVFFDRGGDKGIERLALGGGTNGGLYETYRDPDNPGREIMGDSQWQTLRKVIEQRKPSTIAIDVSHTHAFSDGLSAGEREQLESALGPWTSKLVRAENLPLEYISMRLPEMEPHYVAMMKTVHALIARAFSNEVITPGKTTSQDVEWWLRQSVNDLGLGEWFPPTVSVQRPEKQGDGVRGHRASRGRGHSAGRSSACRFRHLRHGARHRHPARGLRVEGGRDGRSGRAPEGARQLESDAGHRVRGNATGPDRQ